MIEVPMVLERRDGRLKTYVFQSVLDYVDFATEYFRENPDICWVNFKQEDAKDWMKNAYYHAIGLGKEADEIVAERMEPRGRPNTVPARGREAVAALVAKEWRRRRLLNV